MWFNFNHVKLLLDYLVYTLHFHLYVRQGFCFCQCCRVGAAPKGRLWLHMLINQQFVNITQF